MQNDLDVNSTCCYHTGLAHHNNKVTQAKIVEEGAITYLVELLVLPPSEETQVEVAYTLGCLALGNQDNQAKMAREPTFRYDIILDLIDIPDQVHFFSVYLSKLNPTVP